MYRRVVQRRAAARRGVPRGTGRQRRVGPRLPVPPRTGRILVLAGVFVCAACGLVYELELVALASYLIGDSVTQTSVVLSLMVFAMGAGSLAAKRLRPRAALGFGAVETALALVGGCSAMALYAAFAWTGGAHGPWDGCTRVLLVALSLAIGMLIGAEVPLLMVLIQRVRRQDPGIAAADLFAADYVGALVGGLAFPFLLLPLLGQLTGALLTGAVNAVAGGALVFGVFRRDIGRRDRRLLLVANVSVLTVLATCGILADDFERAARHAVYGDDVRAVVHTGDSEVVLTDGPDGALMLFVDGHLRVRGSDEPRYHRALVGSAGAGPTRAGPVRAGARGRALILGGGDGLAAHEVLRLPGVTEVDMITPDPALVHLARTAPTLGALDGQAFRDPRLHVTVADPVARLRDLPGRYTRGYDLVVDDLPEPEGTAHAASASQEFYGLVGRALAPDGRFVVRAGSPDDQGRLLWTMDATLRAAGLRTVPYCVGHWGFVLAAHHRGTLTGAVPRGDAGARGPARVARLCSGTAVGPRDLSGLRPAGTAPSTLVHPRYGG